LRRFRDWRHRGVAGQRGRQGAVISLLLGKLSAINRIPSVLPISQEKGTAPLDVAGPSSFYLVAGDFFVMHVYVDM
jgi:hypothetical protein